MTICMRHGTSGIFLFLSKLSAPSLFFVGKYTYLLFAGSLRLPSLALEPLVSLEITPFLHQEWTD